MRRFLAWHEGAAPGMPVVAGSLDRKTCSAFLADILAAGLTPGTARARYEALRQLAAWLADEGETDANLLLGMRPPKQDQVPVDGLEAAEVAALIKACKPPPDPTRWETFEALRDEAVVRLLADTGMRAGEALGLTTDDVDLGKRLVRIRRAKGGKYRVCAFSAATARAMDRYLRRARRGHKLAGTGRLWLGAVNKSWAYHALRGALARRAEAAGIKGFHPHRLRHTAASAALDAGMAEGDVLAAFGWRSRAMLDRYVADTAQKRAAENFRQWFDEREGR